MLSLLAPRASVFRPILLQILKVGKAFPITQSITVVLGSVGHGVTNGERPLFDGPRSMLPCLLGDRMMGNGKTKHVSLRPLVAALFLPAAALLTGCQVELAGQTLPSPYYLTDDIQYYTPGPEFKLAREAAAMQEQAAAIESEQQQP
jgi:hypothetical protein